MLLNFPFFLPQSVFRGNKIGLDFHESVLNDDWTMSMKYSKDWAKISRSFQSSASFSCISLTLLWFLSIFQTLSSKILSSEEKLLAMRLLLATKQPLKAPIERISFQIYSSTHAWSLNWDWNVNPENFDSFRGAIFIKQQPLLENNASG